MSAAEKWNELQAALERAERKLAMCVDVQDTNQKTYWQMTEHYQTKLTESEARAEKAELALAKILNILSGSSAVFVGQAERIARTALAQSDPPED